MMLFGQSTSQFGDSVASIAFLWMMKTLTTHTSISTLYMGFVVAAGSLPAIIFGPFAGVIVDRFPRRQLMILADILRALILFVLTILLLHHELQPIGLILGYFLIYTFRTIFEPASAVIRKGLVDDSQLLAANAFLQSGKTFMSIAGPSVGGFLISAFGVNLAFFIDGLTFVVSMITLVSVRLVEPERENKRFSEISFVSDFRDGFHTFWSIPYAQVLTPFLILFNLPISAYEMVTVQFVSGALHFSSSVGASVVGYLTGAMSLGEFTGGLLVAHLPEKWSKERLFVCAMTTAGLCLFFAGFSRQVPIIAALYFVGGLSVIMINVAFFTGIQQVIPSASLGRVWAMIGTLFSGVIPLSQLIFGGLATVLPAGTMMSLIGGLAAIGGGSGILHPAIRRNSLVARAVTAESTVAPSPTEAL